MAIDDPAPSDVTERLAEVRRLDLLAASPRGAFDRMAAMAAPSPPVQPAAADGAADSVPGRRSPLPTGESHVLGVPLVLPVLRADGTEIMCRLLIERAPQRSMRSVYIAWIAAETATV